MMFISYTATSVLFIDILLNSHHILLSLHRELFHRPFIYFSIFCYNFSCSDKVDCYASIFQPLEWSLIERPPSVSTYVHLFCVHLYLYLSLSHTHTLCPSPSLSIYLTLSHTHTFSLSHSLSLSHSHTLSLALFLSLSLPLSLTLDRLYG